MVCGFHIDEIDHHQATNVTHAQLTANFFRRFQISIERGFFDVAAFGGACAIDVNCGQRFGFIDND